MNAFHQETLGTIPQLGRWIWQHIFVVVPAVMVLAGLLRTIFTGEITFRDGSYILREHKPLLFWAAVAFFGGFATLLLTRLYQAY